MFNLSKAGVSKQWAERSRDWGSIPGGDKDLSLHYSVETGFEAHPVSRPMGTEFCYVAVVSREVISHLL